MDEQQPPYGYAEINVMGSPNIRQTVLDRILRSTGVELSPGEKGLPVKINWQGDQYIAHNGDKLLLIYPPLNETRSVEIWNQLLEKFFRQVVEPITDTTGNISTMLQNISRKEIPSYKAIICDKNVRLRQGVRALVERMGLVVIAETGDGTQGLELVRCHKPKIVIFDVDLHGNNGIKFCQSSTSEEPNLIKIAYTDSASAGRYFNRLRKAGINGLLLKSTTWNYWWYMLHNACSGHLWIDPHLNSVLSHAAQFRSSDCSVSAFDIQLLLRLRLPEDEIAEELEIPIADMRVAVQKLLLKLGAKNKNEALSSALELGFNPLPEFDKDFSEDEIAESYALDLERWW